MIDNAAISEIPAQFWPANGRWAELIRVLMNKPLTDKE